MSLKSLFWQNAKVLYYTFGAAATLHTFSGLFYSVKLTYGPSMLPTINVRDEAVLISKLYRRGLDIKVGDVVSVRHPMEPDERAVKRVMGMPGDFVIKGTPGKGDDFMIRVPPGHCWLVGDNLESSRDSRIYGPVPLALVQGKVLVSMPWGSWPRRMKNPFPSSQAS